MEASVSNVRKNNATQEKGIRLVTEPSDIALLLRDSAVGGMIAGEANGLKFDEDDKRRYIERALGSFNPYAYEDATLEYAKLQKEVEENTSGFDPVKLVRKDSMQLRYLDALVQTSKTKEFLEKVDLYIRSANSLNSARSQCSNIPHPQITQAHFWKAFHQYRMQNNPRYIAKVLAGRSQKRAIETAKNRKI